MAESPPLLSVILVCKNPGAAIAAALASVWVQYGASVETVVVDGASVDGTTEWLAAHRARITTLLAEPDRNVYEAMNKGVAAARGEWLLFLGADDRIADAQVLRMMDPILRDARGDVLVGESMYDDGRVYRLQAPLRVRPRNFAHHQATFYRRRLFTEHGLYDSTLRVMGDYEFNLRLWKRGVEFVPVGQRIALCGIRGLSDAGRWLGYAEEIRVRHRHFPAWQCWTWDLLAIARHLRKKLLRSIQPTALDRSPPPVMV